ncbi:MAG: SEC-C domain-containing protein [Acidobacteria bacterium]|nr:SEC-C domain-containing protein [Acidobacteriota bacterium]
MTKIKPNEMCPCGSGRKYKKCCAQKSTMKTSQDQELKMEGTWGLCGIPLLLNIAPFNSKSKERPIPGGSPGNYHVTFLLGKPNEPPVAENHIKFGFDPNEGDSHLFVGDPNELEAILMASLPSGNFEFRGKANEKGYLSLIECSTLHAESLTDAMNKAFDALCPILSRISLLNNAPVYISRWAIKELATNAHMSSVTLPFRNQKTPMLVNVSKEPEFERYASLYREGLNSNSPNYQFLCFYKIIEGLRKMREGRVKKENERILLPGRKPNRPKDLIPNSNSEQQAWLSALFGKQRWSDLAISQVFPAAVVGRKVNDVINKSSELDMVRNRIAHTVLRDEAVTPITIDDAAHINEVSHWLPLCKCLALYLLRAEYPGSFLS